MDAELGINLHEYMYVIRHNLHFDDLSPALRCNLSDDRLQTFVYAIYENSPPILRTPDDMILAGIYHVLIGPEFPLHERIIPQNLI